ncbi:hypothetical protein [Chitinophaga sp. MM2321]|uniref:hypothetical protein n=1 Tax=Chitinophaga sp. MM2321 TaxID=3137178 RepID=UPI0032D56B09
MKISYVFQYFDQLVSHELNPTALSPKMLTAARARELLLQITEEEYKVQNTLKNIIFRLKEVRHERAMVRKCHNALVQLINKTHEYSKHAHSKKMNTQKVHEAILASQHNILFFIRSRFDALLDAQEAAPITKLLQLKEEIEIKMGPLDEKLKASGNNEELRKVLLSFWLDFINRIELKESISIQEADYHRQVLLDVEQNYEKGVLSSSCPSLHELLVYWNLNSKESIRYFTQGLETVLGAFTDNNEKIAYLTLEIKKIAQMPEIPNFAYAKNYPGIKDHFLQYLTNELQYLEHKVEGFIPISKMKAETIKNDVFLKVMLALSVDQVAILLRAAEAVGLLIARSLRAVFRAVAPHLSTREREDPSWENMRSKAYAVEQSDKNVLIDFLLRMIKIIEAY